MFAKSYQNQLDAVPVMDAGINMETTGAWENAQASFNQFINEDLSISRIKNRQPFIDANMEAYTKATGTAPPAAAIQARDFSAKEIELFTAADQGDQQVMAQIIDTLNRPKYAHESYTPPTAEDFNKPQLPQALPPYGNLSHTLGDKYRIWKWWQTQADTYEGVKGHAQISQEVAQKLGEERKAAEEVFRRADGFGMIGQFAGAMGGAITDPINLATLGWSTTYTLAKGATAGARIANAAANGFVVNAATETLIQPFVSNFKDEIGADYNISDAITNIIAAGMGGAVLSGFGRGAVEFYNAKGADLVKGFKRQARELQLSQAVESEAARKAILNLVDILEDSPYKTIDPSMNGTKVHLAAYDKAQKDMLNGHWPNVSEITRAIDDPANNAWGTLQAAKGILQQEAGKALPAEEAKLLGQQLADLDTQVKAKAQELADLKAQGNIVLDPNAIASELMKANPKLKLRKAKQQATQISAERKQRIEAGPDEPTITAKQSALKERMKANEGPTRSQRLLADIERMEQEGQSPIQVLETLKQSRPDLTGELKAPPKAPKPKPVDAGIETPRETPSQRAERTEPRTERPEVEQTDTAEINQAYYGDMEGMDDFYRNVQRDVEADLKSEDIKVTTEDGEFSAREMIATVNNELKAAENLRGCLLG